MPCVWRTLKCIPDLFVQVCPRPETVGRCSRCNAYFLIERYDFNGEVVHTKKAAWGREDTGTELNLFKQRMFRSVIELLSPYCPPPAALLDVGCSYGGFLLEARKAGYAVVGFDIMPSAIEYVSFSVDFRRRLRFRSAT